MPPAATAGTRRRRGLHVLTLRTGQLAVIDAGGDATAPFFSPDGQWIAFFSGDRLLRVPLAGGRAETLASIPESGFRSGTWTRRDAIIVGGTGPLLRLPAAGGTPQEIPKSYTGMCIWPLATPDGKHVDCNLGGPEGVEDDILQVIEIATGASSLTGLDACNPVGFIAGHLLYRRGNDGLIMAVPFDRRRARTAGDAFQVIDPTLAFSVSRSGTALFAQPDLTTRLVMSAGDSTRYLWTPPWGQPVRDAQAAAPAGGRLRAGHARQDLPRRAVADRQDGNTVERDVGRVEATYGVATRRVEGQRRLEGRQRVARPGERQDGAALHRVRRHVRAVRVRVAVGEAGIVEHDHAGRAVLLGELHLVAAEVAAVAGEHDAVAHADAETGQLLEVLLAAEVGVDHLGRDVARAGIGVPAGEQVRVRGEGVALDRCAGRWPLPAELLRAAWWVSWRLDQVRAAGLHLHRRIGESRGNPCRPAGIRPATKGGAGCYALGPMR
jgi:hypothetical protein